MKTCNTPHCCTFKSQNGTILSCSYYGFCDYQCPRDSRVEAVVLFPKTYTSLYCSCGGDGNTGNICTKCGLNKD